MAEQTYSTIQLKRTKKDPNNITDRSLFFGEPLYVHDETNGEDYLIIGSGTGKYVNEEKRLSFASKNVSAETVYFKDNKLVDNTGQPIQLQSSNQYLIFKKDGEVVASYNGETSVEITAETIGAISSDDSTIETPTGENVKNVANVEYVQEYVALPTSKGYNVKTELPIDATTPLEWNTEYRLGDISDNLNITLPINTTININNSAEVRLCFYCDGPTTLQCTPPNTIMVLPSLSEFPILEEGYYYEISFANIGIYNSKSCISWLINKVKIGA